MFCSWGWSFILGLKEGWKKLREGERGMVRRPLHWCLSVINGGHNESEGCEEWWLMLSGSGGGGGGGKLEGDRLASKTRQNQLKSKHTPTLLRRLFLLHFPSLSSLGARYFDRVFDVPSLHTLCWFFHTSISYSCSPYALQVVTEDWVNNRKSLRGKKSSLSSLTSFSLATEGMEEAILRVIFLVVVFLFGKNLQLVLSFTNPDDCKYSCSDVHVGDFSVCLPSQKDVFSI